jgi:hypothetical protein
MIKDFKFSNIQNVELGGEFDYPDFVDTYIESADYYENGKLRELTEKELEWIDDEYSCEVYELITEIIF